MWHVLHSKLHACQYLSDKNLQGICWKILRERGLFRMGGAPYSQWWWVPKRNGSNSMNDMQSNTLILSRIPTKALFGLQFSSIPFGGRFGNYGIPVTEKSTVSIGWLAPSLVIMSNATESSVWCTPYAQPCTIAIVTYSMAMQMHILRTNLYGQSRTGYSCILLAQVSVANQGIPKVGLNLY
jgi:hypothetical protein